MTAQQIRQRRHPRAVPWTGPAALAISALIIIFNPPADAHPGPFTTA